MSRTKAALILVGVALAMFALILIGAGCRKKPAPPARRVFALDASAVFTCQIVPGQTVGVQNNASQLCKADGTVSVLFYGESTMPSIFYPDADQHQFFDTRVSPFPVVNGKLYAPVLRASGTQWFTMPCFGQYIQCRNLHAPPWPTNTCETAQDWQVFNPTTLEWTGQAAILGGPLLPHPDVDRLNFFCPTPVVTVPAPTITRTRSPTPPGTPPLSPSRTPSGVAPSPTTTAPCPVCPTCPPVSSPPPAPSRTLTPPPGPLPTRTLPCFPPFCVSPRATPCTPPPGADVCPTPDHLPLSISTAAKKKPTAVVTVVASSGCSSKKNAGVPGELVLLAGVFVGLRFARRRRP